MRKYIDIINEFAGADFEGDGGGDSGRTILVYDIIWDTDGEDVELPSRLTVDTNELDDVMFGGEHDEDDLMNQISDWLSEKYSWCLSNFNYQFI